MFEKFRISTKKNTLELLMNEQYNQQYFEECGNYAMRWNSGQISDDEVDMDKIAYTKDNLYDIIADAIGQFQAKFPNPIPIDKNGQTVIHIAEILYNEDGNFEGEEDYD